MGSETPKDIDELYKKLKEHIDKNTQALKNYINEKLTNITSKFQDAERKINELKKSNEELKKDLLESQREAKKNNIIVFGLEEEEEEGEEKLYSKVLELFNKNLKSDINKDDISHTYRFGKAQENRPISVKLVHYRKKLEILRQGGLLKDSKVSIASDLTRQDREDQQTLRKHLKQARAQNLEAYIKNKKLVINDTSYSVYELKKLEEEQDEGKARINSSQENPQQSKKEPTQKPINPQTQSQRREQQIAEKERNLRPGTTRSYKYK